MSHDHNLIDKNEKSPFSRLYINFIVDYQSMSLIVLSVFALVFLHQTMIIF